MPSEGVYLARFSHPRLDTLGVEESPDAEAILVRGQTSELELGGPPLRPWRRWNATGISTVSDAVLDDVKAWQARPLEAGYPIVYLDATHVKMRTAGHVQTQAVYLALALNLTGGEGAPWPLGGRGRGSEVLAQRPDGAQESRGPGHAHRRHRRADRISGGRRERVPKTQVQLCIVHMVRGSLRFVCYKDRKAVARDLHAIYRAPTLEAAEQALKAFEERWDARFPMISRRWRDHWSNLTTLFDYPPEIRRVMYTTNAIEAVNAQLRKRRSGAHFPISRRCGRCFISQS